MEAAIEERIEKHIEESSLAIVSSWWSGRSDEKHGPELKELNRLITMRSDLNSYDFDVASITDSPEIIMPIMPNAAKGRQKAKAPRAPPSRGTIFHAYRVRSTLCNINDPKGMPGNPQPSVVCREILLGGWLPLLFYKVVAARGIAKGEELTLSYGPGSWQTFEEAMAPAVRAGSALIVESQAERARALRALQAPHQPPPTHHPRLSSPTAWRSWATSSRRLGK